MLTFAIPNTATEDLTGSHSWQYLLEQDQRNFQNVIAMRAKLYTVHNLTLLICSGTLFTVCEVDINFLHR